MNKILPQYTKQDFVNALRNVGVQHGDVLFVQMSLGRLGYSSRGKAIEDSCITLHEALRESVGTIGTIIVPSYTYSIGKGEIFDLEQTPSTVGEYTEFFRKQPGVIRSADPMLSVAGIGPQAKSLLTNLPHTCFGDGSVYDRLYKTNARIVNVGLGLYWSTYLHYIEECCRVPYRFHKLFTGHILQAGQIRRETWTYFASPYTNNCLSDAVPLEVKVREAGLCLSHKIGRGEVCSIGCREYRDFATIELSRKPWFTAVGPAVSTTQLIALEDVRIGAKTESVHLSENASMKEMIQKIAPLPRDIVSDSFDVALYALAKQIPMKIHEYPTGTKCFTWIVPEKWSCQEAWIENLKGERLLDLRDSPLHVMSYSQPYEGEISRAELIDHLEVHPHLPDGIPFSYSYFHRKWGLCCTKEFRDSLQDERYRVCIKAATSYGSLKVGEVIIPGEMEESFVLCAHLDHPGQANDGLSGVAVGIEVMRRLMAGPRPRYTIRLLILSETFGSLAWLSHNEELIPKLHAGLFLEMLGLEYAHALQFSQKKETVWDKIAEVVMRNEDPNSWTGDYLTVVTNDDRQFNAPGIRVPMLSLSRVKEASGSGQGWPFPEYHSHLDNASRISTDSLENSAALTLKILRAWDDQIVPVPQYQGEPCLTRFGVNFDFSKEPEMAFNLFIIIQAIDGKTTVGEIASTTGLHEEKLMPILIELARSGLVKMPSLNLSQILH